MKRWAVALLWLALAGTAAGAQHLPEAGDTPNTVRLASGAAGQPATLAGVRWLVGHWTGTGLGGAVEEVWAEAAGGVMMGMYRLLRDGAPSFYEFMHLAEDKGSLVLKVKHFNPDMTAWEEKDGFVAFPLVRLEDRAAFFSGLTFKRTSDDTLEIYLALRRDGKVREEKFELRRQ